MSVDSPSVTGSTITVGELVSLSDEPLRVLAVGPRVPNERSGGHTTSVLVRSADGDFRELVLRPGHALPLLQGHADYPHEPGTLYDCPACESTCVCDEDDGTWDCVACALSVPF